MSDTRWQRVEEIFHRAAALAPPARPAFLEEACGADQSLRREVESLLAHQSEDGVLFAGSPKTIAHYRILDKLGEGGMGAVYRATDTKLGRQVAIKVLPRSFADDPDRMARFTREAKVLASLNHPNIAQIYGLEDGALIMELVPGETLKRPLPIDTALNYAKQIAEALEAAHEKGIVHRDLKPGNIVVTPEGVVKLLDFGLAAVAPPSAGDATVTMQTTPGTIMGTAAYMSPEQAAGKPVDKRADIWSFGVVLYEMLTGHRLFEGENPSQTLAAVLRAPIDLDKLPPETLPSIRNLLSRCLDREVKTRLRDIGEARIALACETGSTQSVPVHVGRRHALPWGWGAAAVAAALAVMGVVAWLRSGAGARQSAPLTLTVVPPSGITLGEVGNSGSAPEMSPDGSAVLFGANGKLYVRRLDSPEPRVVPGSEAYGNAPFWSADSTTVAFPTGAQLLKVRMPDGAAQSIAPMLFPSRGGSWSDAGTILISTRGGLSTVPASGGEFKSVEMPEPLQGVCLFPEFLPGSDEFLFMFVPAGEPDDAAVYIATLRAGKAAEPALLLKNQTAARYTPAGGGRILFVRNDNLYSQKLNRSARKLEGEAELVAVGVASQPSLNMNRGDFSVARNGTVAWRPGKAALSQVTVFDRQGKAVETAGPPGSYRSMQPSPNEKQLLVTSVRGWLVDVRQPGRLALPSGVWLDWTAGATRLIGFRNGRWREMSSSGLGDVQELGKTRVGQFFGLDISSDGKSMIASDSRAISALDAAAEEATPLVVEEKDVQNYGPRFSPDGRWFVYERRGVGGGLYVQPFQGPGSRRQISPSGEKAVWRKDGKEIVYFENGSLMSVTVEAAGAELRFGAPRKLFSGLRRPPGTTASTIPLAISRDGSRIFWLQGVEQPDSNMIYIKTGWVK